MKFGKQLRIESKGGRSEWARFYVDYKLLKKVLKLHAEGDEAGTARSVADTFGDALRQQVKQCSAFLVEKVEELETIVAEDQRRQEAYLEVLALGRFASANFLAVTKLVKKRNKLLQRADGPDLSTLSISHSFFSSPRLTRLVAEAEHFLGLETPRDLDSSDSEDSEPEEDHVSAIADGTAQVPPKLSGQETPSPPALTVVLDLDQTLIFSSKRSDVFGPPSSRKVGYWTIQMDHVPYPATVFYRPGLKRFLRGLASLGVDLVLFTAGIESYASPIVDKMESFAGVTFSRRFYREATTRTDEHKHVKDLTKLGTDLSRTVLLDDNPLSYCLTPFNGVPVMPFSPAVGEQEEEDDDDEDGGNGDNGAGGGGGGSYLVQTVLPVVRELAEGCEGKDVRQALKKKYNMQGWFAQWRAMRKADSLLLEEVALFDLYENLLEATRYSPRGQATHS